MTTFEEFLRKLYQLAGEDELFAGAKASDMICHAADACCFIRHAWLHQDVLVAHMRMGRI